MTADEGAGARIDAGLISDWGRFSRPLEGVDLLDARWPRPGPSMPRGMRRMRRKRWQHFGLVHPAAWIGFVVFDAGMMGVSFVTVSPWDDASLHLDQERIGRASRVNFAGSIWDGHCSASWPGYDLRITNDLKHGRHHVTGHVDGARPVRIDLTMHQRLSEVDPLVALHPVSANRPFYTHKSPMAPEGEVTVGDRRYVFDPQRDTALLDEQCTFYPLRWFWRWATFVGRTTCGKQVAFNGCHNVLKDDENRNENGVWVDGRLHALGAIRFRFDEDNLLGSWKIHSTDGRLELRFRPLGLREGGTALGPLGARFAQPWGMFEGRLPDADGQPLVLEEARGVCERQDVIG